MVLQKPYSGFHLAEALESKMQSVVAQFSELLSQKALAKGFQAMLGQLHQTHQMAPVKKVRYLPNPKEKLGQLISAPWNFRLGHVAD